jgi:hypothetical protein
MRARFLATVLLVTFTFTGILAAAPPQTVVIPAGTSIHFALRRSVNTGTAKVGQHIPIELTEPIVVGSRVVAKDGAKGFARISEAEASGRVGGSAKLTFSLASITLVNGQSADVRTSSYSREGKAHAKHNATYIAGGAVAGALLGQALGGNSRSTAKGAAAGAGVGIGAAAATGKFDFEVPAGEHFSLKLKSSVRTTL